MSSFDILLPFATKPAGGHFSNGKRKTMPVFLQLLLNLVKLKVKMSKMAVSLLPFALKCVHLCVKETRLVALQQSYWRHV